MSGQNHECSQGEQFAKLISSDRRQNLAIFGNPETLEIGMIGEIKAIRSLLEQMQPTYKELDNWGTFFQKGRQLGLGLAIFITSIGVIFGGVLAVKEWFKK